MPRKLSGHDGPVRTRLGSVVEGEDPPNHILINTGAQLIEVRNCSEPAGACQSKNRRDEMDNEGEQIVHYSSYCGRETPEFSQQIRIRRGLRKKFLVCTPRKNSRRGIFRMHNQIQETQEFNGLVEFSYDTSFSLCFLQPPRCCFFQRLRARITKRCSDRNHRPYFLRGCLSLCRCSTARTEWGATRIVRLSACTALV
jgi:hypothetical protein